MTKAKFSKLQKQQLIFGVCLALTVLFICLTIGLAARPYSTIMPYVYKDKAKELEVKTYFTDEGIKVVWQQGNENGNYIFPMSEKNYLEHNEAGALDAFTSNTRIAFNINGIPTTLELRNVGNFIFVFLFAIFAVAGISGTVFFGIKAFKK